MRNKSIWLSILLHFMLVIVGISILPQTIPAHFGFDGTVDRMGSSFELLLIPLTSLLLTTIFLLYKKHFLKKNNEKYMNLIILGINLFFVLLSIQCMLTAYYYVKEGITSDLLLERLTIPTCGLFFILLGNYMPKLKNNGLVGLRTSWSMANDVCWYHSQRLGGFTFMVLGVLLLVICPFLKFKYQMIFFTVSMISSLIIDVYGSYRIYLKYKNKEDLR